MKSIREWVRKYPKAIIPIAVVCIALSVALVLITPLKVQILSVHDFTRQPLLEVVQEMELEEIDNLVVQEDIFTDEDVAYVESLIVDSLLGLMPDTMQFEVSLADIESACAMYTETRSFIANAALSADTIEKFVLQIVLDLIFDEQSLSTEEQIFQVVTLYQIIYYALIVLAAVSIILVIRRHTYAAIVWLIPAVIVTTGFALLATVGTTYVSNNIYEEMYIRFPMGILASILLAGAAALLYRMRLQVDDSKNIEEAAEDTETTEKSLEEVEPNQPRAEEQAEKTEDPEQDLEQPNSEEESEEQDSEKQADEEATNQKEPESPDNEQDSKEEKEVLNQQDSEEENETEDVSPSTPDDSHDAPAKEVSAD